MCMADNQTSRILSTGGLIPMSVAMEHSTTTLSQW